jgi:Lecithin retinol acyltransferase
MLSASVSPANEPVEADGKGVAARVPSARSNAYVNGRATRNALRRGASRADRRIVQDTKDLSVGAHLLAPRRGYTHHGIYIGNGRVVHYAGLHRALSRGPVEEISLEEFADGQCVLLEVGGEVLYPVTAIVERARSRLGENRYRLTTNNCEHFCEWCLRGESRSEQVELWLAWPRKVALNILSWMKQLLGPRGARAGASAA